ncbi:MAG TPA: SPFH domain-containing protein [Thermotogota bacterium]|nr:SPFH domain-containing protein [Thermotogota bacterium]
MADTDKVRIPKWTFTLVMVASIVGILVIYFSTGFYNVAPSEVGLVKRFGKYVRTDQPGINYHLPAPFDSVTVVDVLSIRKIEIGFRTVAESNGAGR